MYSFFKKCFICYTKFSILSFTYNNIKYYIIPNASYLIHNAVLAANVLDTLPFNLAGALPTKLA